MLPEIAHAIVDVHLELTPSPDSVVDNQRGSTEKFKSAEQSTIQVDFHLDLRSTVVKDSRLSRALEPVVDVGQRMAIRATAAM